MPRPRRDGTQAAAPNKRKLNDLMVKRLAAQHRPYLVWDSHQRGLAVSVQPTGGKSWKVIYSRNSRPRWYHLGAADAIALSDARKLAARVMFAVAEGKDPAAERKADRSRGTFEELAARYVAEYAKKNNKSWKQAETLVRRYLVPRWGKLQAADISRADVKSAMAPSMPRCWPIKFWPRPRRSFHGPFARSCSRIIRADRLTGTRPVRASVFCPTPRCRNSGRRLTMPGYCKPRHSR